VTTSVILENSMSVVKHVLVTLLAATVGWVVVNGILWLYVEFAGPFYPDATQQQRNFDHYLIGSLMVIGVFSIVGNIISGRWKR